MKKQSRYPKPCITTFKHKEIITLTAFWLIFFCGLSFSYTAEAGQSIPQAIKKFAKNKKRMRIAVLDFANTSGEKTRFDGYIADTIVSELSKYSLTLLERKRLKMLLKEHALSQSGVIDSKKALKMGMLLPLDAIVSGSYTHMGHSVVINGRFIHVGSGEILYAFTASIKTQIEKQPKDKEKPTCEPIWQPVNQSLKNLKDKKAINYAVDCATGIPFEGECGKIHYQVMSTFIRFNIFPQKYNKFLIDTLISINDPSNDERTRAIARFLSADKTVDNAEWKAMLTALKKMNDYALHIHLSSMLNHKYEKKSKVRKRIDEIIKLTKAKKIGRPLSFTKEKMFFSLLSGLNVYHRKNMAHCVYMFEKYQALIPHNDKYSKKAAKLLNIIYLVDNDRDIQKKALKNLIRFYQNREKSELLATRITETIRSIESKIDDRYEQDENKKRNYKNDLKTINKSLPDMICMSVAAARKKGFRSQVEDRIEYILKYNIPCEHAPSIRDLENDMRSGDWDRKLKAIELLSKIGTAAKPAEQTVIKYLGQQGFGRKGGRLRRFCAVTLGNIKTTDPKGITLLIESFPDYNNGVSHEAKETIKKINVAALPYLIKGLAHEHHAVRYGCAEALGNLGREAEQAVEELKKIAQKDDNPYVRKQAKGAVQMIENSF
ncbi:MAG: FlgO family outer membrane protein [Thermodesulfobacteriota bacterium]|nr:FlgO family outer membrane protein [Thermodesulfobacteriota bacterium]